MAKYKSYTHVERLEKPECAGLLDNDAVYVTAKIDGTNAVVWYDTEENCVCGGSRTRKLDLIKDNASFYSWLLSDQEEAILLRHCVTENPNLIIYGEWLGLNKFVGSIKTYNSEALGHLYIFDVFDTAEMTYLHEEIWRGRLSKYFLNRWFVPILACLNHPSYEDIVAVAESNKFLLDYAENKGEGVVCKAPGWRNNWGNLCYGKIVLSEFHERKEKGRHKPQIKREGVESDIIDYMITESEMAKAKAKACNLCEVSEFDVKSGKMIGIYLNMVYNDLLEEINFICKKWKNPVIDFSILKKEAQNKARQYIGLI